VGRFLDKLYLKKILEVGFFDFVEKRNLVAIGSLNYLQFHLSEKQLFKHPIFNLIHLY
jgi:hypothetical protein